MIRASIKIKTQQGKDAGKVCLSCFFVYKDGEAYAGLTPP